MAFGDSAVLISDFTGADENPLSEGGNWANLNSSGNALQRIGNAVSCTAAGAGNFYWTLRNYGPNVEAYLTLGVTGGAGIVFRAKDEGGSFTWDGYVFTCGPGATTTIQRVDNSTGTNLFTTTLTWNTGDKLGARIVGSGLALWQLPSGGSWTLLATVQDSTYPLDGKIGVRATGTTVRVDDFFAGDYSDPIGVPAEFPPRHFGPF